eukprot:gene13398-biopygen6115
MCSARSGRPAKALSAVREKREYPSYIGDLERVRELDVSRTSLRAALHTQVAPLNLPFILLALAEPSVLHPSVPVGIQQYLYLIQSWAACSGTKTCLWRRKFMDEHVMKRRQQHAWAAGLVPCIAALHRHGGARDCIGSP